MGKIGPAKAVLTENSKKIFLTAQDKRNCFCCLVPIFIEQLDDSHRDMTICNCHLALDAIEKMSEVANRLEDVFSRQDVSFEVNLREDFRVKDLIAGIRFFKNGPVRYAEPSDLTYINCRIKQLIESL